MRLIDATELEKRSNKEMFEINKYTLRLAPTVDAIPVSVLKEWQKQYSNKVTFGHIMKLVDDWRKENA